jgi:hypothetical protein
MYCADNPFPVAPKSRDLPVHAERAVTRQVDRQYNWPAGIADPTQHRFGKVDPAGLKNGVELSLKHDKQMAETKIGTRRPRMLVFACSCPDCDACSVASRRDCSRGAERPAWTRACSFVSWLPHYGLFPCSHAHEAAAFRFACRGVLRNLPEGYTFGKTYNPDGTHWPQAMSLWADLRRSPFSVLRRQRQGVPARCLLG